MSFGTFFVVLFLILFVEFVVYKFLEYMGMAKFVFDRNGKLKPPEN